MKEPELTGLPAFGRELLQALAQIRNTFSVKLASVDPVMRRSFAEPSVDYLNWGFGRFRDHWARKKYTSALHSR